MLIKNKVNTQKCFHINKHGKHYTYIYQAKSQCLVRTVNAQETLNFNTIKGYTRAQKQRFWKGAQPLMADNYRHHNY